MVGKCKKKGIMGGTFDPIHIGHLILGENACLQLGLDSILFMPSGNPPHKPHRPGRATTMQRVEMVRLAIEDNPHFELSLAETHDQGYTYTEETLRRLTAENPDTDYYFIMGADSLFQFEHWKGPEEICRLATLVVAVRNHVSEEKLDAQILHLKEILGARIEKLDTPNIDISSETLRSWIASGHSLRYYVPNPVISYIEEQPKLVFTEKSRNMEEYNILRMQDRLKEYLTRDRFIHTQGVMYTATALAMCHGEDLVKAQVAGLLHDCAKCIPGRSSRSVRRTILPLQNAKKKMKLFSMPK